MTDNGVNPENLTPMEIDVIGEVMNISMGAAATAMSTILGAKVSITTPQIESIAVDKFEFTYLEPVIGVLINYVEGIDGSNVLLLKEEDMKKILSQLFGMEIESSDEIEFDEISTSAVGEIMNQMMGAAAGALASFLGKKVNISPPTMLDTSSNNSVRELFSLKGENLVSTKFQLIIEDMVDSEFISAMEPALAREIVEMSMGVLGVQMEEEEVVPPPQQAPPPQPAPPPQQAPPPQPAPPPQQAPPQQAPQQAPPQQMAPDPAYQQQAYQQAPQEAYQQQAYQQQAYQQQAYQQQAYQQQAYQQQAYQQPPPGYQPGQPGQQPGHPPEGVVSRQGAVEVSNYNYRSLDTPAPQANMVSADNLELIMSVPIQITVELGRTQKKIKDIAELTLGNIVELDRQAGDQVDVIANGRLIARGDVVVVDDNYSVKITEIMKAKEELSGKK